MKKTILALVSLPLVLLLSSWGYQGHHIISQNSAACLPAQLAFLKPGWTNFVTTHCADADNRKGSDPNEAPKHYIDIENYPQYGQTGQIPQNYDSVVAAHGLDWVIAQGILPWATKTTYDSLTSCFRRGDWNRSELFAADLGHYVGDGHMPLHITVNYDGQMTGQTGIHSRYETKMITQFEAQLVYPADSAHVISNVQGYIFDYLYGSHVYVDSVLQADLYAKAQSGGSVTSTAYYQALWAKTSPFTIRLFRDASRAIADLIYTAWVEAGSQVLFPNGIAESGDWNKPGLLTNFPNPVVTTTTISFELPLNNDNVQVLILDEEGNLKDTILNQSMSAGSHKVIWDATRYASGIYFCVLKSGKYSLSRKMVIVGN